MSSSPLEKSISGYLDQTRLVQLAQDPDWAPAQRRVAVVIPITRKPVQAEAAAAALAALRIAQTQYRKTVPAPVALRRNWSAEIVGMAHDLAYCPDSTAFESIKRDISMTVELAEADWHSEGWDAAMREAAQS